MLLKDKHTISNYIGNLRNALPHPLRNVTIVEARILEEQDTEEGAAITEIVQAINGLTIEEIREFVQNFKRLLGKLENDLLTYYIRTDVSYTGFSLNNWELTKLLMLINQIYQQAKNLKQIDRGLLLDLSDFQIRLKSLIDSKFKRKGEGYIDRNPLPAQPHPIPYTASHPERKIVPFPQDAYSFSETPET